MVPDFSFEDGKGNVITSKSLLGKSYCLVIWDTACSVSKTTLSLISELIKEGTLISDKVYAINIDQSYEESVNYFSTNNIPITPFIDSEKSTKWAFNANLVPLVYCVNENGVITVRTVGWSDSIEQYLLMKLSGE